MGSPSYSVLFSAVVSGTGASGSPGDVLIPETNASGAYVLATTAARAGRRSTGIALSSYIAGGVVEIQQSGQLGTDVTGLAAGTASWVRVSSAGRLERCSPAVGDDIVGRVDTDGRLFLECGMWDAGNALASGPTTGAELAVLAAAAATAGTGLVIATTVTITTALGTIAVPIRFDVGGKFVLNTGGSVTLTGALVAPVKQIFDTSGGGTITCRSVMEKAYPQWWGAVADGTTDDSAAIQKAITAVAFRGGTVFFVAGTYAIATMLTWSSPGVSLIGVNRKWGTTASASLATALKWTGASGSTMITVVQGGHYAHVEGINFDCNDLANTGLVFATTGGASVHILHRPVARNLQFGAYRGAALVYGNPDTTVLDSGQLQMAVAENISWIGGGPTATVANVFGLVLNAQNCEILMCYNLYFDPYTVIGGGPNINHQTHIKVKNGGLKLDGAVFTRATSYSIDVLQECGLVVDHVRSEDPLFLRMAAGEAGNPIHIRNIQGRDGTSTGSDIFISIAAGGNQCLTLENIHSTGHIRISAADNNSCITRNIVFVFPATSTLAFTGGAPWGGNYDVSATPGSRKIYNTLAKEEWFSALTGTRMYQNDRGRLRVTSLQGLAASSDCLNFGGTVTVTGASTLGTVTFGTAEVDASYRVILSPLARSGVPAAGSNAVNSDVTRTAAGFTFNTEVAPGGVTTVTFAWLIFRT